MKTSWGALRLAINRIRQIKPDFFEDEKVSAISLGARLFFIGLWCRMDRNGVIEDKPRLLKTLVFPFDDEITSQKIEDYVQELCNTGLTKKNPGQPLLVRVRTGRKVFLYAPSFVEHQSVNHREKAKYLLPFENIVFMINDMVERGEAPSPNPGSTRTCPVHNGLWVMVYGIWVMGYGCEVLETVDNSEAVHKLNAAVPLPDKTKKQLDKILGRTSP